MGLEGRTALKPEHDEHDLCQRASVLLKRAGFVVANVSMKTEAVYYRFPGRTGSIRVATHKATWKPHQVRFSGKSRVIAKLTFRGGANSARGKMRLSETAFILRVQTAIGKYLLEADFEDVERHDGGGAPRDFPCGDAATGD